MFARAGLARPRSGDRAGAACGRRDDPCPHHRCGHLRDRENRSRRHHLGAARLARPVVRSRGRRDRAAIAADRQLRARDIRCAAGLDGADAAGHRLCLHFRQTRAGTGPIARRCRMTNPFSIWVYLSATPLLWLALTLVSWIVADAIAQASGRHPLVNPVLIAIAAMGAVLIATGTPYETYFQGAQFVHFLLGPATVAIAVPLVRHLTLVRANIVPMIVALLAGAVTAVVSVVTVAAAFGVPREILVSLAPKSVTAGIAMAITESMGGRPALTAVLVIATGIMGAVIVTPLMNALKITDYAARGFAVGLTSHGIGTARAFAVDEIAGTFAGIAMGLNGVATWLILPLLLRWL